MAGNLIVISPEPHSVSGLVTIPGGVGHPEKIHKGYHYGFPSTNQGNSSSHFSSTPDLSGSSQSLPSFPRHFDGSSIPKPSLKGPAIRPLHIPQLPKLGHCPPQLPPPPPQGIQFNILHGIDPALGSQDCMILHSHLQQMRISISPHFTQTCCLCHYSSNSSAYSKILNFSSIPIMY